MTGSADGGAGRGWTRRRFFLGAATVAAGGAAAGVAVDRAESSHGSAPEIPKVALGSQPAGLPARQFAWTATLKTDRDGNPIAPRHDRLLFFDVQATPSPAAARLLEASLRTLERAFTWGPGGLLFTAGWAPGYFERSLQIKSPIPRAKRLSEFELPAIDDYDLCLHLACDDERRLADVEAGLVHGAPLPGSDGHLSLAPALRWRETRTGFVGQGLPAAHQDVGGIPPGSPVTERTPLFMGFKSGLARNQATEDAVTIPAGAFAQGTTMQVSYMRLRLDGWYDELSERERIARMYAPQVTPEQVKHFTTDAKSDPNLIGQAISHYGVIGHSQTSARARRHGQPVIIRRDFNTVDGGQAGLHFVSIQRSIADFVRTRNAMNASSVQLVNPGITDTVNNGINEFIFVLKRANYIIPSRALRSFPLLPGRQRAL
jgi:dye decolorizing peroxidase